MPFFAQKGLIIVLYSLFSLWVILINYNRKVDDLSSEKMNSVVTYSYPFPFSNC